MPDRTHRASAAAAPGRVTGPALSAAAGILAAMQRIDGRLVLSPTDLTKHVACPHVTTLDLEALQGGQRPSTGPDDALNLVFAKGLEHEYAYLAQLRAQGLVVEDIADLDLSGEAAEAATVDAMRRGVDVVYQATFFDGHWVGLADFLLKVELPPGESSVFGDWRYDIADTKLARRLKVPALLQMATYAARLETLQGMPPRWLTVVTGDRERHAWRLVDVAPYARRRRADLEDAVAHPRATESARVEHCGQCRWKERCAQEWVDRDDLVQVAGMRADHRAALVDVGIPTLRALAEAPDEQVARALSTTSRRRLHQQARLQMAERETGQAQYELLPHEPRRGLQMLPEPDAGDVYLDFEGDPWADGGAGREYLAGVWTREGEFTAFWAHDFAQEGRLTADLVDWLTDRWTQHPAMHVYHYAPYETTALKRLVGQHATREAELDQLLRHEVFVDLYAVVRQGVRISKGSYSIKKLEEFYWGTTRSAAEGAAVADGLSSVVEYERWLAARADDASGDPSTVADEDGILEAIRLYNREDVRSTHALHEWLEQRRDELERDGQVLSRPGTAPVKELGDIELAEIDLAERLVDADGPTARLLAGLVGWHRREKRPEWWDYFRYKDLETAELVEDATAIGGLGEPEEVGLVRRSRVWRYPFPPQDCRVSIGGYVPDVDTHANVGKVVALDPLEGWIDLSMAKALDPPRPRGIGGPGPVMDQVLRESIARTAELALAGGSNLATRLLDRVVPAAESLRVRDGETPADVVVRVGRVLDGEVLAVQGPPGAGKTWAGSALIRALLDAGLTVGVTAQSHAVVLNLLGEVGRPALHKDGSRGENADTATGSGGASGVEGDDDTTREAPLIDHTTDNAEVVDALASGRVGLVGGTAWLWSREDMTDAVDVLVVDEAGQFSLANAVAVAPAARSLVLLGDPQQLTQPTKAVHPYGSGVSALDHLRTTGEGPTEEVHDVVPSDRGVFLDVTHRMHPDLTAFVSELAYEDRLHAAPGRDRQRVDAPGPVTGHGLFWMPVTSRVERAQDNPEEAEVVAALVDGLLDGTWTDAHGDVSPLRLDDVLVVTPYNAQVAALVAALPPGARVGTVDKFQGQQAAVVVYSMASSSAAASPRGVPFLFDLHRLNVAVSRARALAVVVADPRLLDAGVHTPDELRAVNALCRLVDVATEVRVDVPAAGDGDARHSPWAATSHSRPSARTSGTAERIEVWASSGATPRSTA
ncbi:uncharacterized protein FHW14_002268 [Terracoccus luteus]|uniref:AAA+ ATPase domain-containing protein n=2 Tax=Terracoccus luteus TaxID=53356 RepID=A0A839PVL8_9MICO|nr:uncharacterized protein [Terracoccus luteus]